MLCFCFKLNVRPGAVPDMVPGCFGLGGAIGDWMWLLHFGITLDLAAVRGLHTPGNAGLGYGSV